MESWVMLAMVNETVEFVDTGKTSRGQSTHPIANMLKTSNRTRTPPEKPKLPFRHREPYVARGDSVLSPLGARAHLRLVLELISA